MTERIPLAKPELTKADRSAVMQVLQTTHLSMGPQLAEFERALEQRWCVRVGNIAVQHLLRIGIY